MTRCSITQQKLKIPIKNRLGHPFVMSVGQLFNETLHSLSRVVQEPNGERVNRLTQPDLYSNVRAALLNGQMGKENARRIVTDER
ncbi:Unknown protein sequence [Pseudomonas syringae pv. maculicola]|nr:Unknown protein sequence [Pseudomonas syringae pv. maculicola]